MLFRSSEFGTILLLPLLLRFDQRSSSVLLRFFYSSNRTLPRPSRVPIQMPAAKDLPQGGAVDGAAANAVVDGAKTNGDAAAALAAAAAASQATPTSTSTSDLDRDYERVLAQLGTLISGRSRGDGRAWEWEHAMEVMALCLERAGLVVGGEECGGDDNTSPSSSRSTTKNQLNKLRVIHVTGTKGKGSTCAMTESILRSSGYSTGLFTSPHLWDVRERIRVNGRPVDKRVFIAAFDDLWARLESKADERVGVPAYFKFLTLLGLKIFVEAGLDVVVLEVGIGGRLDATNCVPPPVASGFTPLGFDHLELLGNTLPLIATEKSGIIKRGSRACFVVAGQPPDAGAVLVEAATKAGVPFSLAPPLADYKVEGGAGAGAGGGAVALSLSGEHQRVNASLAVALSGAFDSWVASLLEKGKEEEEKKVVESVEGVENDDDDSAETFHLRHFTNSSTAAASASSSSRASALRSGTLPSSYAQGLQRCVWHGRAQVVVDESVAPPSSLSFYLDGAHTPESSATCASWFAEAVAASSSAGAAAAASGASGASASTSAPPSSPSSPPGELRLLLFNCMHEREPLRLLAPLSETLSAKGLPLAGAVFVPPDSTYAKLGPSEESASTVDLSWQQGLAQLWRENFAVTAGAAAAAGKEVKGNAGESAAAAAASAAGKLLPPLPTTASNAAAAASAAPTGAVAPSVRSALEWLRSATRASPGLKMRVLVTGSLYLVGDVLRHLGKNEE